MPAPPVAVADAAYLQPQAAPQTANGAGAAGNAVPQGSGGGSAAQDVVMAPRRVLMHEVGLAVRQAAAKRATAVPGNRVRALVAHAPAPQSASRQRASQRSASQQAAPQRSAVARPVPQRAAAIPAEAPAGTPQQIAAQLLAQYGWAGQFSCLYSLWSAESGWNVSAENPSSGAYGIPQALPGAKMSAAGPDWESDAATQIRWGLTYIQQSYGSPCAAWAHEEADGWY